MKGKYSIEFEIPDLPKTINVLGRKHWTHKVKEANKWKQLIKMHVGCKRPENLLKQSKLTLTRISSVCPDSDGLVSSFKHCIDGLIECGVLENDKYQNIGMPEYLWEKGIRKEGKIRIKVEEL